MNKTYILESGVAKGTGQRRRAKVISADVWGSSAFYPGEVLARDAATAFPAGTKMYENHFTESETWERPEGDVSKLVGKLISNGSYESDNPEGPGVYADVEFYDSYVSRINEIGDDVGLSVNGGADYVEGERDGRYGKIVTGIPFIKSVDVVVAAGAGGKLISILESAGPMAGRPINTEGDQSVTALTKEDFVDGLKTFGETLTTAIKESLVVAPAAPAVEPVVAEVVAPAAPAAPEAVAPATAEVVAPAAVEDEPVVIDQVALATAFAASELPVAVMPSVVASIQEGKSIEDAIKAQTLIKEAFRDQDANNTVRIVEANRQAGVSLRDQILANVKK